CPGGSLRSTRCSTAAPARTAVKSQISREAPPGSRRRPSTLTGTPSSRPTNAARPAASSADVVEILRPAEAHAVAPPPLRQALGDARDDTVPPVSERDHRQHAARDLLGRAAVHRVDPHPQCGVELLVAAEVGVDLDLAHVAVRGAVLEDVPAFDGAAVALDRPRRGDSRA